MKQFFLDMLSESSKISSTRFLNVMWNIAIMIMTLVFVPMDMMTDTIVTLFLSILGINNATKAIQHRNEKRYHNEHNE